MDEHAPAAVKHDRDPRMYLAAERTFLAWIRTGLALMGFGFVVARFGLFLRELRLDPGDQVIPPVGFSTPFGIGLVLLGVAVEITSAVRYRAVVKRFDRGLDFEPAKWSGMALAFVLGLIGRAMAAYLLVVPR